MADRVHPTDSPPAAGDDPEAQKFEAESHPARPKSETYVIQIPKDQIYRVPPPENAHLFQFYSRRGAHRRRSSPCCRCLLWTLCSLLALLLAVAVTAGVLYFVFHPKLPSYSLDKIAIQGFDLNRTLSPQIDVTVRADNPNDNIGVYYDEGSEIGMYYAGIDLCRGYWPVFYQGHRNVTVFDARLKGSAGIRPSSSLRAELADQQRKGRVPLEMEVSVPVRIKFGAITSWRMKVKVKCDVVLDRLTTSSKMVSRDCRTKVDI